MLSCKTKLLKAMSSCSVALGILCTVSCQAQEKQALQEKQAAFMKDVEEWSQGEVEALQAAAAERLKKEQLQVEKW